MQIGLNLSLTNTLCGAGSFSPPNIVGIQAWYDAAYPNSALQDGAAHFTSASQQYLSVANNLTLQTGPVDFWIAGQVYFDSVNTIVGLASKRTGVNPSTTLEYQLWRDVDNTLNFSVGDGVNFFTATSPAVTTNTWYFILAWYDSVTKKINLKVSNGTTFSTSFANTPLSSTGSFFLGRAYPTDTLFLDGREDSMAFGKSPVGGISGIIDAINTSLYNGGSGKTYSGLTAAEKTAWGLVSWWDLNEESGTRFDAHGTNDLTASTLAIISGATLNGNFETAATNGGTIDNVLTSTRSRTTNVATIVTASVHGLTTGNVVTVSGMTDTTFNATNVTVTVVNTTTFTYANTGSNVVSGADTGGHVLTTLFANWSANSDLAGGTGTVSNETSIVHGGTHAVKLVAGPAGADSAGIEQTATVVGDLYLASYWTKAAVGGVGLVLGGAVSGVYAIDVLTTTYAQFSHSFKAIQTALGFRRANVSSTLYIDDVVLTNLGPVGIDGIAAGIAVDGNFCGNFVSSSNQTLSVANNASLNPFQAVYSVAGWFYFNDVSTAYGIVGKTNQFGIGTNGSILYFRVIDGLGSNVDTVSTITPTPGSFFFFAAIIDTTNHVAKFQINTETIITTTLTNDVQNSTGAFTISNNTNNFVALNGRADAVGVWKGHALTSGEITALFNHGNGLKSGGLAAAGVTTPTSYWDMDKVLGITADSIGTNTLTNNNAVTFAQGVDYFGGAVSKEIDQSSFGRNMLQATEAIRPVWYSNVQNGKPGILFSGTQMLQASGNVALPTGTQARTVFVVFKQTTVQSGFPLFWNANGNQNHCGVNINGNFRVFLEAYYDSGIAIANNTTYVVAFVFDASGNLATYVNGVAGATFAGIVPVISGAGTFALGAIPPSIGLPFAGYVFDGIIYNSALTVGQVAQEFNYFRNKWAVY